MPPADTAFSFRDDLISHPPRSTGVLASADFLKLDQRPISQRPAEPHHGAGARMTHLVHSFWLFVILLCCGVGLSFLGMALQHDHPDRGTVYILRSEAER